MNPQLNPIEQAVYDLIKDNSRITQLQISRHEKWLGCHEKHEAHLNIDKQGSTLRKIRQIVRDMRFKGIMILSDKNGYYLLENKEQAKEFIERLERTARAQAASWMQTYFTLKKGLGVESDYFEKQAVTKVREHTRRKSGGDLPDGYEQPSLF